jgi:hypothetical protein
VVKTEKSVVKKEKSVVKKEKITVDKKVIVKVEEAKCDEKPLRKRGNALTSNITEVDVPSLVRSTRTKRQKLD